MLAHPKKLFILKPGDNRCAKHNQDCERSRVVRSDAMPPSGRPLHGSWVIQDYLSSPLLLNGRKFDLRFMLLVTSSRPSRMFLYKQGAVRVATHPFSLDRGQFLNRSVHITTAIPFSSGRDSISDSIHTFEDLLLHLRKNKEAHKEAPVDQIWQRISSLIKATHDLLGHTNVYELNQF